MKKRCVSLLSAAALLTGLLAGPSVSASESGVTPLFSDPVKLSLFTASNASYPFQEDWYVIDLVKEYTNVDLEITAIDTEGFTEKLNLLMASGDLPDLVYQMNLSNIQQYGPQGAYINILDYIDEMPNFKAWYEENTQYALNYLSSDGALYITPQFGVEETNRRMWLYRQDVFEKLGLETPTNQEEFYEVLVKLKEAYPDSYPLAFRSFSADLNQFNMLAPSWGTSYISGEDNTWFGYDYDTGEWTFGPTSDSFKEMVEFYHKLYEEGLLLPNFLTIDTKGWQDVIANSDSFITLDYIARIDFFNSAMRGSQPEFTMAYMAPPAFGTNGVAGLAYSTKFPSGFSIYSQTKNLENALKYVDWTYSDEAREVLSWGRPGELYTEAEDGTRTWNDYETGIECKQGTGLQTYGFYSRYDFDAERSTYSPEAFNASVEAGKVDLPQQPVLSYNEEEQEVIDTAGSNILRHVVEQVSKFLLGERDLGEWDDYVAEVEALGLDDLKAVHESSYARVLEVKNR